MKIKTFLYHTILSLIFVHSISLAQQQYENGKTVIQLINPITKELPTFTQTEKWINVGGLRDSRVFDANFDGSVLINYQQTILLNQQRDAVASILDEKFPSFNHAIEQINLNYAGDQLAYISEDETHSYIHIINPITKKSIASYSHERKGIVDGIIFLEANSDLSRLAYTYNYGSQYRGLVVLNLEKGKITKILEVNRNSMEESPYETLNNLHISDSGNHIFYNASYQSKFNPGAESKYIGGMYELSYDNENWVGPTKIESNKLPRIQPLAVAKDGEMIMVRNLNSPYGVHIINRVEGKWSNPVTFIEKASSGFNKYMISADGSVISTAEARLPLPPLGSDAPIIFDINVYFYDESAPNLYRRKQLTSENVYTRGHLFLTRDGTRVFWNPEVYASVYYPDK